MQSIGEIFGLKKAYLRFMREVKGKPFPPGQLPDSGREMVAYLNGLPEDMRNEFDAWNVMRLQKLFQAVPTNWKDRLTDEQLREVEQREQDWDVKFFTTLPSGVPASVLGFDAYRKRKDPSVEVAKLAVESWMRRGTPYSVVLAGAPGSGKSHLLEAAGYELRERHQDVLFRHEGELSDEWKQSIGAGTVSRLLYALKEAPWLVIDDMGTAAWGEAGREMMDTVYDNRWRKCLKTLVATNSKAADLPARIASRLGDVRTGVVVNMTAPDYRRKPE